VLLHPQSVFAYFLFKESRQRKQEERIDKMKETDKWKSSITSIAPGEILIRGYPVEELMVKSDFASMLYLMVKGELPGKEEKMLLNAMLIASVDHGPTPPSAIACRVATSGGAALSASVAAGVLAINRHHGGAIESCMEILQNTQKEIEKKEFSPEEVVKNVLSTLKKEGKRLPGFGHRFHKIDPRAEKLLKLAKEQKEIKGNFIKLAEIFYNELKESTGKSLPLNVDGAIAVVMSELGFSPQMGNGIFIAGRVVGLIAHSLEEQNRMKPMRLFNPLDWEYDGPPRREVKPF